MKNYYASFTTNLREKERDMTLATNQPQAIIYAKAGFMVPKELFETALRKCPTVSGFSCRDVEGEAVSLVQDTFDKVVTIENLMTINEQTKAYHTVFYLANLTQQGLKTPKEEAQPFSFAVQLHENGDPQVLVDIFVEGDFFKHSDPKSGHTDEYNFVQDVVIPMLGEMIQDVEGDVGKFTAKLHSPNFKKNLLNYVGNRAFFCFLPLAGEAITFGKNELGASKDWGETSQHLDYEKKEEPGPITKAAAAVVAGVKKFDMFGGKKDNAEATTTTVIHQDDKGVNHITNHQEAQMSGAQIQMVEMKAPAGLEKGARNLWLRTFNGKKPGSLPDNHEKGKDATVWVTMDMVPLAERKPETKEDVNEIIKEISTGKKAAKGPVDFRKPANELPVSAVVPAVGAAPNNKSEYVPDMTDKDMTEQTTILAGFIDREKVPTAREIQGLEKPFPTYDEKMGIPIQDMYRYTTADLMALMNGHKPSVMIALTFRRELMKRLRDEELVSTKPKASGQPPIIPASDVPLNRKGDDIEIPTEKKGGLTFGLKKTG